MGSAKREAKLIRETTYYDGPVEPNAVKESAKKIFEDHIEDWEMNCDQKLTDGNVYLRSADWYREKLKLRFDNLGGGLYLRSDSDLGLYELERL